MSSTRLAGPQPLQYTTLEWLLAEARHEAEIWRDGCHAALGITVKAALPWEWH